MERGKARDVELVTEERLKLLLVLLQKLSRRQFLVYRSKARRRTVNKDTRRHHRSTIEKLNVGRQT